MFVTIVAWVVFVITSFINIVMIQELMRRGFSKRYQKALHLAEMLGKGTRFAWERATVFFVLWFISGYYLFEYSA